MASASLQPRPRRRLRWHCFLPPPSPPRPGAQNPACALAASAPHPWWSPPPVLRAPTPSLQRPLMTAWQPLGCRRQGVRMPLAPAALRSSLRRSLRLSLRLSDFTRFFVPTFDVGTPKPPLSPPCQKNYIQLALRNRALTPFPKNNIHLFMSIPIKPANTGKQS